MINIGDLGGNNMDDKITIDYRDYKILLMRDKKLDSIFDDINYLLRYAEDTCDGKKLWLDSDYKIINFIEKHFPIQYDNRLRELKREVEDD